jgi:hypothetical protein
MDNTCRLEVRQELQWCRGTHRQEAKHHRHHHKPEHEVQGGAQVSAALSEKQGEDDKQGDPN